MKFLSINLRGTHTDETSNMKLQKSFRTPTKLATPRVKSSYSTSRYQFKLPNLSKFQYSEYLQLSVCPKAPAAPPKPRLTPKRHTPEPNTPSTSISSGLYQRSYAAEKYPFPTPRINSRIQLSKPSKNSEVKNFPNFTLFPTPWKTICPYVTVSLLSATIQKTFFKTNVFRKNQN